MDDNDVIARPSWLRRYWAFVLRIVIWASIAVGTGIVLIPLDVKSGIALVLFFIQMGLGSGFLGLIGKSYHQQLIDNKEASRRMWMVSSTQMAVLVAIAVLLLFSADPLSALLPVVYMPVRVFLALKSHQLYKQEASGTLFQKGRYD